MPPPLKRRPKPEGWSLEKAKQDQAQVKDFDIEKPSGTKSPAPKHKEDFRGRKRS